MRLRRVLSLPKRAYLTLRYHGGRELLHRLLTAPRRLLPRRDPVAPARRWYREHARPVTVVLPTYGDPSVVAQAVDSVRQTTARGIVRVVVADDGSAAEHVEQLRAMASRLDCELVLGDAQRGFAANCNRGLRAAAPDEDAVLLNSDVLAHPGWLEVLQHTAHVEGAGIVGGRLLYPDGTIQFAGGVRNPHHPAWFDHRYRTRDAELAEANVPQATLTVTGACMYMTRAVLDDVGLLDENYEMAFEDVDYCVRAWDRGHRVAYAPAAVLTHYESKTRGHVQGERELRSRALFWERWGDWFDGRDVTAADGGLRIVYVVAEAGEGGLTAHVEGLRERGHEARLLTGDAAGLEALDAIKVATDPRSAEVVWEASVRRGVPVYLVRELDAIRRDPWARAGVRPEFDYLATSAPVAEALRRLATSVTLVEPGNLDELERFYRSSATRGASRLNTE